MRSEAAATLAGAAFLLSGAAPLQAAGPVGWIHVCGSEAPVPLRLPLRKDAPAPCHAGACVTAERKRPKGFI